MYAASVKLPGDTVEKAPQDQNTKGDTETHIYIEQSKIRVQQAQFAVDHIVGTRAVCMGSISNEKEIKVPVLCLISSLVRAKAASASMKIPRGTFKQDTIRSFFI